MKLPAPPDLSIAHLADLWKCHPDQILTYIREGWLRPIATAGDARIAWDEKVRFEREQCGRHEDAREMKTALTMIAIMARHGYGSDLSSPYELAREVQRDGQLIGLALSDITLAKYFKRAKPLLSTE